MRRPLLLSLMAILAVLLGAECDGSSGSSTKPSATTSQSDNPGSPAPEPSAALIFGAGLLTAWLATRRR